MTAIYRDVFDLMPKAKHSASRAAVIAAVVMDHRVLVIRAGNSERVREEFDAAVELAEGEFGDHVQRIYRSHTDRRILFEDGGEVLFAPAGSFDGIRGYNFDMILEASA
ncbi:hypothetical protein [Rhodococcus sp. JT-3]|uniref:hypothetical protein n=1 Tax=Rhodococcus sp. JT-3 TaxID=1973213 RepID=UPI0013034F0D|nr:hypothetical protein [Rhodococcus sp. JT-3]